MKNLYSLNLENLKEMDDFLDPAKPSKLNHEVNNLNRPITNEGIEIIIKSFLLRKVQ